MAADSAKYLSDAVHMHSLTDPAQEHISYLSSTPEQRTMQQLAVSSIDSRILVKEYTYSIAARAIQVTLYWHCSTRRSCGLALHWLYAGLQHTQRCIVKTLYRCMGPAPNGSRCSEHECNGCAVC